LSLNLKTMAALSLVAALFHTLNHATFKALLFMGAGSVISQTHTRNMEKYGGLIKFMPRTAFYFLIGSLAISALPPFNGFFSEWLTFQTLFSGIHISSILTKLMFVSAAGALAFTGGLAAACFVKAFGATFLARPRSKEVLQAKESDFSMRFSMGTLAFATLVLGIFAGSVSKVILGVVNNLNGFQQISEIFSAQGKTFTVSNGFATVSTPIIFVSLTIVLLLIGVVKILTIKRKVKIGCTWDCGTKMEPQMEITATGFARSIIMIFKGVLKPSKQLETEYHDADMRYFPKSRNVKLEITDVYQVYFYRPLQNLVVKFSDYVKNIQNGILSSYIAYIFFILLVLLLIFSF